MSAAGGRQLARAGMSNPKSFRLYNMTPANVAPQIVPRGEIKQLEVDDPAHLGRRHTVEGRLQVDVASQDAPCDTTAPSWLICTAKKTFLVRLFSPRAR
jgi:hypothetical protein